MLKYTHKYWKNKHRINFIWIYRAIYRQDKNRMEGFLSDFIELTIHLKCLSSFIASSKNKAGKSIPLLIWTLILVIGCSLKSKKGTISRKSCYHIHLNSIYPLSIMYEEKDNENNQIKKHKHIHTHTLTQRWLR